MGRRTELNDINGKTILNAIAEGQTRQTCAEIVGINPDTLYTWLAKGRGGHPTYAEFTEKFYRAEAEFKRKTVQLAFSLAERDYKYLMDFLSRRFPQEWGTLARQPEAVAADSELANAGQDDLIKALEGKGWKKTGTDGD